MEQKLIEPEHILLALLHESKGVALFVCEALELDADAIIKNLKERLGDGLTAS